MSEPTRNAPPPAADKPAADKECQEGPQHPRRRRGSIAGGDRRIKTRVMAANSAPR